MNIGFFTKEASGEIVGNLPTMNLRGVRFRPITKQGIGPDYTASLDGADLGAVWSKTTETGKSYLSFKVVIPGQRPIYLALFTAEKEGEYAALYSEPRKDAKQATPSEA